MAMAYRPRDKADEARESGRATTTTTSTFRIRPDPLDAPPPSYFSAPTRFAPQPATAANTVTPYFGEGLMDSKGGETQAETPLDRDADVLARSGTVRSTPQANRSRVVADNHHAPIYSLGETSEEALVPPDEVAPASARAFPDLVPAVTAAGGTMDAINVYRWLTEQVGLQAVASNFLGHEIDEEALLALGKDDLRRLGVESVGAMTRMQRAISVLKDTRRTRVVRQKAAIATGETTTMDRLEGKVCGLYAEADAAAQSEDLDSGAPTSSSSTASGGYNPVRTTTRRSRDVFSLLYTPGDDDGGVGSGAGTGVTTTTRVRSAVSTDRSLTTNDRLTSSIDQIRSKLR